MSDLRKFYLNRGNDLAIVLISALYISFLVKQLFSMAKVQQISELTKITSIF